MSRRDDYLSRVYVGDESRAEENVLNNMLDSIEETLCLLKVHLEPHAYKIVRECFENNYPIKKEA